MAYTKKMESTEGIKGGWQEFGTFTLDPGSIAANTVSSQAVAGISNVAVGDMVFVQPVALDTGLDVLGAVVTGTGAINVVMANRTAGAVDGGLQTYNVMICHINSDLSGGS